jgi:Asp-tRNA(Asn)/Glu-tRNA(Gln) amidotransferase A subunit family amidase
MNLPWTHAGLPVINLPVGKGPQGLPLGIQLAGNYMHDEKLLQLAEAILKSL